LSAISSGGYASALAIQCCLRQRLVVAIELGDQCLVIGLLARSAFEEKAGFVWATQITQEHGVVNFHRRLQSAYSNRGRGDSCIACSRSPDCAARAREGILDICSRKPSIFDALDGVFSRRDCW